MHMDAIEVASAAMVQAGDNGSTDPQSVLALAECITLGGGGFRVEGTRTCYLVLGDVTRAMPPDYPQHMPVVLRLDLPARPQRRQVWGTRGVAHLWRLQAKNASHRPDGYRRTWAPAATQSHAMLTIGGTIGDAVGTSPDPGFPENTYRWYDMASVPAGGVVYRINRNGLLTAVLRFGQDVWVRIDVPADQVQDFTDMHAVVNGLEDIYPAHNPSRHYLWTLDDIQNASASN